MMTQSVVTKQLSFIFSTICKETRTNPSSERDRGGVCFFFFWVMSVLLSLARGIKDARQAEEWEIKLKLG